MPFWTPEAKDYRDARLAEAVSGLRKNFAGLQVEFSDKLWKQTRWLTGTCMLPR